MYFYLLALWDQFFSKDVYLSPQKKDHDHKYVWSIHTSQGCHQQQTNWSKSSRGISLLHIRFGTALAKTRTKFQKKLRRRAYSFLRDALRNPGELNSGSRVNRAWIAGADLQPIVDYLASKWHVRALANLFSGRVWIIHMANRLQHLIWEKFRCQNAQLLGSISSNSIQARGILSMFDCNWFMLLVFYFLLGISILFITKRNPWPMDPWNVAITHALQDMPHLNLKRFFGIEGLQSAPMKGRWFKCGFKTMSTRLDGSCHPRKCKYFANITKGYFFQIFGFKTLVWNASRLVWNGAKTCAL